MRIALAGLFVLLSIMPPAAHGQSQGEMVRLLVPVETQMGSLDVQSIADPHLRWKRVVVPVEGTVDETVGKLERDLGTTVLVERRYPLLGGEAEPLFGEQWGLENTGQQGGTTDADIDVAQAWPLATGEGVVVAVIDSGVNPDHPELDDQIWRNTGEVPNGVDDDGNGFIDDVTGWDFFDQDNDPSPTGSNGNDAHATFVAGVIAAEVDGVGMTGVAPDATIMNVRACDNGLCWSFDAALAIHYAVDNGADIINLSFGGPVAKDLGDPPLDEAIEHARKRDVLVVSAAGNAPPESLDEGDIIVPAELPHSNNVAVAATDRRDRIADFSFFGDNIDIAAPGVAIVSTSLGGYAQADGTSFAAPFVAGAAALLLSHDPGVSHFELSARLEAWADSPPGVAGKVESGRLNAGALLIHRFVDTLGHTFEGDAGWAADAGVTQGCNPPDNTIFCPDESVTREQMAAFLRRHLDLPPVSKDYFTDDSGSTFENDINRLAEAGITKGCNPPANDHFCPEDDVTRGEMAAFLVRAFDLTQDNHPGFADVPGGNIFKADIEKLATAGITKGCSPPQNTLFCPNDEVTRGQMTAFLHRTEE